MFFITYMAMCILIAYLAVLGLIILLAAADNDSFDMVSWAAMLAWPYFVARHLWRGGK